MVFFSQRLNAEKGFSAQLSFSLQRKMEFLDEETRPKIQFQSRFSSTPNPESETLKINKPLAITCVFISSIIFILSILFLESKLTQSLLLWLSISLSLGPFAPISVTGGDIHVGQGELLESSSSDLDQAFQNDDSNKRVPNRRQKVRRSEDLNSVAPVTGTGTVRNVEKSDAKSVNSVIHEEKEWIDEDFELLKKQLLKHPVGEPKRWEKIAEGFNGRHGLDSVIKMAKSMPERKPGYGDAFSQFLKQRKPLDKRIEEVDADLGDVSENKKESNWSAGEDIALLNALKAFPKESPMRWEKIEAAVPGKTKACCMKRVAELKKGFRSSKAPGDS